MDNKYKLAEEANSVSNWDALWSNEETAGWRQVALKDVYDRIIKDIENGSTVIDIGAGRGDLCVRLRDENNNICTVADHSPSALEIAKSKEFNTLLLDLNNEYDIPEVDYVISTETAEHLAYNVRSNLFNQAAKKARKGVLISVPNNILPPEREPQHTVCFNAISLKNELLKHFTYVRIICIGNYILAECGEMSKKSFTLSVTMPAYNEAADLERTLASFRSVADQMVIGVDPRSTDNTFEIAKLYAEDVFYLENPDNGQGEGKVDFSHIRNQGVDRCTSDFIFASEAHERLHKGEDIVLRLDQYMGRDARVMFVKRTMQDSNWMFPWIWRRSPDIRFSRAIHNVLLYPDKTYCIQVMDIVTLHERADARTLQRIEQRRVQNRTTLLKDWMDRKSENSLYYLGQEWKQLDLDKSIARYEEFVQVSHNGPQVYQAKMALVAEYLQKYDEKMEDMWFKKAKDLCYTMFSNDWSRIDHCIILGDLCYAKKEFKAAYWWYKHASIVTDKGAPFCIYILDPATYSYIPCQRLTMICCELEWYDEALVWAKKVVKLIPEGTPVEITGEAKKNVKAIRDYLKKLSK